jgi:2-phosphosulfolactate phosphatase
MTNSVVIDCFPESALRYGPGCAIVAVDVIRATTMIATAVFMGRRCFPVASLGAARQLSTRLRNPLLAGEVGGVIPHGFELNNSPARLALRTDISRPLILLTSAGTKLIHLAQASDAVYIASLRNFAFLSKYLAQRHKRIVIIGAGSRGEFREEDQMCCAWIAQDLLDSGYFVENPDTATLVERWKDATPDAVLSSASADFLIRTGQVWDLEFVLTHIADIPKCFVLKADEVVECGPTEDGLALRGRSLRSPISKSVNS